MKNLSLKTISFLALLFLLSACHGGRYYFNKRIDHQDQPVVHQPVKKTVTSPAPEKVEVTTAAATQQAMQAVDIQEPQAVKEEKKETKTPFKYKVEKELAKVTEPVKKTVKKLNIAQVATQHKTLKGGGDMNGWAVFALVMLGIGLLTFLFSLLLGYTALEALKFAAIAIFIVIILLVILLLKAALSDDDDDCDCDTGTGDNI